MPLVDVLSTPPLPPYKYNPLPYVSARIDVVVPDVLAVHVMPSVDVPICPTLPPRT